MGKTYNIHTIYKRKGHIFVCKRNEYFDEVAKYYKLDLKNISFYHPEGKTYRKITKFDEIEDLKTVYIYRKDSNVVNASLEDDLAKKEAFIKRIIDKLIHNTPFNDDERQHLKKLVENEAEKLSSHKAKKRKYDDAFCDSKPKMAQGQPVQSATDSYPQTGSKPKMKSRKTPVHPSVESAYTQTGSKPKMKSRKTSVHPSVESAYTQTGLNPKMICKESPVHPSVKSSYTQTDSKPKLISEGIQVHLSAQSLRDSYSQTDVLVQINTRSQNPSVDVEDIIIEMKNMSCNAEKNKEDVKSLMDQTFKYRRNFITIENPPVVVIRDNFPLLFNINEVRNELDRLFYQGKCMEFLENIEKYSSAILDLGDPTDKLFIKIMYYIDKAKTATQKKYAMSVGSIILLPELMNEEPEFITYLKKDCPKESFPYIDASLYSLKELFSDTILYKIIVEERDLCEAPNFKEAILCLMACFFIIDIQYPENCMQTLIVFERLYLSENHTRDDLTDSYTQKMIEDLKDKVNPK